MKFRLIAILFLLTFGAAAAQPVDVMPVRVRITPSNAADVSLYMLLARRAERVLWSPGASLLAVVDGADVDLYNVTDWQLTPRKIRLDQTLTDLAFSADGRVLYTLIPGSLVAWSTADGSMSERYLADARRIAVSPDGAYVAMLARLGVVQVMDVATRQTYTVTPTITADDLAFSSDGRRLFVSDAAGGGEILDLGLRRSETVFAGSGITSSVVLLGSAAYTADGRRVLAQSAEDAASIQLWNVRTGEKSGALTRPAEYQRIYGWGLNTRANIVAGAAIGMSPEQSAVLIWPLAGGDPLARLRHPGVRDAQPSPDGTLIASVGGGTLRLWAAEASLPTPAQAANLSQINVLAACNAFNARPALGQVLDGQYVSLVWSWYASTTPFVRDYVDAAMFRLDLDGVNIRPWIFVTQTLPDAVNDDHPTVYFYAPVGQIALGQHRALVEVTWVQPISDGFADYGPGTASPSDGGSCDFTAR